MPTTPGVVVPTKPLTNESGLVTSIVLCVSAERHCVRQYDDDVMLPLSRMGKGIHANQSQAPDQG
jgi:hypothetical protein